MEHNNITTQMYKHQEQMDREKPWPGGWIKHDGQIKGQKLQQNRWTDTMDR